MDILVLGSLQVARDGVPVYVRTGRKPRLVLAVLVSRAEHTVSADALITAVWGERAPVSARRNLQQYVQQLRSALGADRLVRRGDGYAAVVGDVLDAARFRRLAAAGEAALISGDAVSASQQLRAGLDLWRGPAFADFLDYPAVAQEAADLEQLRLGAYERWAEAELALGRHAGLVAELAELTREHPYREGLRAQLMRALYRGGRQAEALEAFRQTRALLRDQLGIEPGHELRRLHEAMLRGDEDPDPTAGSAVSPLAGTVRVDARVPQELPPQVHGFVGRAQALRQLDAMLPGATADGAAVICVIAGTAGVGKTALAVRWGHRVIDHFPDGQLHVNLRGYATDAPVRPIDALAIMLRALGTPPEQIPADLPEATARYRSLTARRRLLIVLDNAASAEQIRPLLPGGPGCLAVVTSRNRLTGLVAMDGARRLTLDVLTPTEAEELLGQLLGQRRAAAEPAAVTELAKVCAQLPLALRIAAAHLDDRPHNSIASYVTRLHEHDPVAALTVDGDEQSAVQATFDLSYRALPETARRVFRRLGVVALPDFTPAAVAALAAVPEHVAAEQLNRLAGVHLVEPGQADRYTLHDLLRGYAKNLSAAEDRDEERLAAKTRLFDWYLTMTATAMEVLYPDNPPSPFAIPGRIPRSELTGPDDARRWLDAEHHNLAAAILEAAHHEPRAYAWQLAERINIYYHQRRFMVSWLTAARAALAAARASGDKLGQASALMCLTSAHYSAANHRRCVAAAKKMIALSAESGWVYGEAVAQVHIGIALSFQGDFERAATHLERARDLYDRMGQPYLRGIVPVHVATAMLLAGRLHEGVGQATTALTMARQNRAARLENHALLILGELNRQLGHHTDADDHLALSLTMARDRGGRFHEAATLTALARLNHDTGRVDLAGDQAESALHLAQQMGERRVEAEARNVLGSIHLGTGRHDAAIHLHRSALHVAQRIDYQYQTAAALIGLAATHQRLGDHATSLAQAQRALRLARDSQLRVQEGRALTLLAGLHHAQGDRPGTLNYARQALINHQRTGYHLGQTDTSALVNRALHGHLTRHAPTA